MTDDTSPEGRATASFFRAFDTRPEIVAQAPGRVNLIGDHTDYNDGFVLPAAISAHTAVAAAPRSDRRIRVVASDFGEAMDAFALDQVEPLGEGQWQNHVRGMAAEMRNRFPGLNGVDMAISGNIPQGSGLSSSASIAVAVGMALITVNGLSVDPVMLARAAQASERSFVGTQCGIMDQLASACGKASHALMIDCRDTVIAPVPMHKDLAILIVQSGVVRQLAEGRYNARRRECEAAAAALGASSLRDVSVAQLLAARDQLDDTLFRRARHVVSENARVLAAARALADGDFQNLGLLMAESHRSLRDDFEVSHAHVDRLVGIAQNAIGSTGGARMTGGGFGGAVVAVCPQTHVAAFKAAIAEGYRDPSGRPPLVVEEVASAGATARAVMA